MLLFDNYFCIPTFAEYKPIPANLSKQYKKEMEHIIDVEYPNTIKNADNYLKEAKTLRNKILKHGFNTDEYMNIVLISGNLHTCFGYRFIC